MGIIGVFYWRDFESSRFERDSVFFSSYVLEFKDDRFVFLRSIKWYSDPFDSMNIRCNVTDSWTESMNHWFTCMYIFNYIMIKIVPCHHYRRWLFLQVLLVSLVEMVPNNGQKRGMGLVLETPQVKRRSIGQRYPYTQQRDKENFQPPNPIRTFSLRIRKMIIWIASC